MEVPDPTIRIWHLVQHIVEDALTACLVSFGVVVICVAVCQALPFQ